jgi:hypothetical protein
VKIDPDASACSLAHFSFSPFKVFFQTSEKDDRRRLRGEAVDVLRIQDDRQDATRDGKSWIPRGELSPNLNVDLDTKTGD